MKLQEFLEQTSELRVCVLTGAGISAESGLQTFRDSGGLWNNHRVEEVATYEAFARNPKLVYDFYNQRRRDLRTSSPNRAHTAIAELEELLVARGGSFLLITQNVDDLHDRAGSRQLIHMHGELLKVRCEGCETVREWHEDLNGQSRCDSCDSRQGAMRPHIVWFGEMPLQMDEIYRRVEDCNLFVSIGTSSQVYPAAGLSQIAAQTRAFTLEINLEATGGLFNEVFEGPATEQAERLLKMVRAHLSPGETGT